MMIISFKEKCLDIFFSILLNEVSRPSQARPSPPREGPELQFNGVVAVVLFQSFLLLRLKIRLSFFFFLIFNGSLSQSQLLKDICILYTKTYTQTLGTNVASLLWLHWSPVLLHVYVYFSIYQNCSVNKLWSQISA